MIISEKQIMQLITIAHAAITNLMLLGANRKDINELQILLADINDQQSEELREIE